jgi:hypothetical protein
MGHGSGGGGVGHVVGRIVVVEGVFVVGVVVISAVAVEQSQTAWVQGEAKIQGGHVVGFGQLRIAGVAAEHCSHGMQGSGDGQVRCGHLH